VEIKVPVLNYGNFIGRIGESMVEKYLRENDFIVLGKEHEIPYIGARVDFIVTKNEENIKKFKKRPRVDYINYIKIHPEYIVAEFKGKDCMNWSYEKLKEILLKISEENPSASITYSGTNDYGLIFYNVLPGFEEEYMFIKDNFCLIEVKTSLGKYPKEKSGSNYTKAQKLHYYDVLLRVKIEKNFENGFKGLIHPKDLEQLYSNHKILDNKGK